MAKRDYYEVLGVSRDSDAETIKKAYRKMAMQYHPDRNEGDDDAAERFKEVGEAYAILSDEQKRARYDRFGHAATSPGAGGGFGGMEDIDPFEIFRNFMGGFGFGDIFGGAQAGGGRGPRKYRGRDLQINLKLALEEVAEGVTKKIRVNRFAPCEVCDGSGVKDGSEPSTCSTCKGAGEVRQVTRSFFGQMVNIVSCPTCDGRGHVIDDPCTACKGEGRKKQATTVEIKAPAGVADGNYMTMRGDGHVGPWGGPRGDLIVVFEIEQHEQFERHNDDVLHALRISITEAVLGTEVDVPTLNGPVKMAIPPGTQPGKVLRLRGKGIGHLNASGRGDQLVRVDVFIPQKLTPELKKAFEGMKDEEALQPPQDGSRSFFGKLKEVFFGAES